MNIPPKPWEYSNGGSSGVPQYVSNTNTDRLHSSAPQINGVVGGGGGSIVNNVSIAPPIPPRPGLNSTSYPGANRSYSAYSSPYSTYGSSYSNYSPYGGSPYGGIGTYGGGMYGGGLYGNRYGGGYGSTGGYGGYPSPYNGGAGVGVGPYAGSDISFAQLAEESSASAFQSIESFVSAFGSISAMLDSTFHAVYSSFRAVVGVADHLGRLKQVFSALAIFKFVKWVFRRFLYLIGISKIKPEDVESVWRSLSGNIDDLTSNGIGELGAHSSPRPSSWPIIMFLGFIFAGPYLMWKLLSSFNLNSNANKDKKWASGEGEHFIAQVEYDFEGLGENELAIRRGQNIRLAPARYQPPNVKGWVMASDGSKIGIVPTNYIKVKGKRNGNTSTVPLPLPTPSAVVVPVPATVSDNYSITIPQQASSDLDLDMIQNNNNLVSIQSDKIPTYNTNTSPVEKIFEPNKPNNKPAASQQAIKNPTPSHHSMSMSMDFPIPSAKTLAAIQEVAEEYE